MLNNGRESYAAATSKQELKELATFARKIATETLDPYTLEAYNACRLITLNKNPGSVELQIRPIGVGEVIRRIVGKTIMWSLNSEIQEAGGPLQVASGLKGGAEAAIHSMKIKFEEASTDAILLVDAENTFNQLNRFVALHNIRYICPPFETVLINTYRIPHPAEQTPSCKSSAGKFPKFSAGTLNFSAGKILGISNLGGEFQKCSGDFKNSSWIV